MSASTSDEIRAALVRQMLDQRRMPIVAHLLVLAVVAVLIWPAPLLLPWALAILVLLSARLALWRRLNNSPTTQPRAVWTVRATMIALGQAWGIGTAIALHQLPAPATALIVLGLAGLLAGGLATLVADAWTYPLYAAAMFVPVVVSAVLAGQEHLQDIGVVLIVAYLVFTTRLHAASHRSLVQRLEVEETLRQQQRQLREAQETAHVGSWEFDLITQRVTWSDEAYRLWGRPVGSPVGYAEFVSGVHPDDRQRVEGLVGDALAERRNIDYECRVVRPDGEVRHLLNRNVVTVDSTGRTVRLAGTCLDITQRKLAEEQVKALEGILPICASCKRIRVDGGQWQAVESYVREHSNAEFSHGVCPDCARRDWGGAIPTP